MDELLESTVSDESDSFLRAVRASPALAIAGFVLATCSLLGVGLLSGSTYVAVEAANGRDFTRWDLVPATLVGAGLAAVIALVSYRAWQRSDVEAAPWVRPVALAATIVAGTSVAARLVVAVLELSGHSNTFARY